MAADQPRSQGPLSTSTLGTTFADVSGSTSSARNFLFDSIVSLSCDSSLLRQNHVYSNCCIAVPMHPSVSSDSQCSSTLRRFVFSAENKLKRILRLNHIWPITTKGNNTNNQSEFDNLRQAVLKRGKTRVTTIFGLILIGWKKHDYCLTIRPVALEGGGSYCFSITQLVGQKRQ